MKINKTFIKDYYSKEFKEIFIEYFDGFGIEINEDCEIFDDITKSAEEGEQTLAYVNEENKIAAFIMFQIDEFESTSNFFKERVGFMHDNSYKAKNDEGCMIKLI